MFDLLNGFNKVRGILIALVAVILLVVLFQIGSSIKNGIDSLFGKEDPKVTIEKQRNNIVILEDTLKVKDEKLKRVVKENRIEVDVIKQTIKKKDELTQKIDNIKNKYKDKPKIKIKVVNLKSLEALIRDRNESNMTDALKGIDIVDDIDDDVILIDKKSYERYGEDIVNELTESYETLMNL